LKSHVFRIHEYIIGSIGKIRATNNHITETCMERIVLFTALVFCTALFLFTPAVHAWQANDPWIHQRLENQGQRINRGVTNGRLTSYEAARLWDVQTRIHNEEMLMKSDGKLTGRERLRLHHELNHSSRAIHHLKHNGFFAY
jgi:hypothetical protein